MRVDSLTQAPGPSRAKLARNGVGRLPPRGLEVRKRREELASKPATPLLPQPFYYPLRVFLLPIFVILTTNMPTLLSIVQEGDPVLRARAADVDPQEILSSKIQTLIKNMLHTLATEKLGAALAAPQVGASVRIFVVAPEILQKRSDGKEANALVCINPEITNRSKVAESLHEGCLSLRGWWGYVPRSEKVTMRAYDEHGKEFERGASGLLAQVFQHEIDHLNGILYIDSAADMHTDEELKNRETAGKHEKRKKSD